MREHREWQALAIKLASAAEWLVDRRRKGDAQEPDYTHLAELSDREREAWAMWMASPGEDEVERARRLVG